MKTTAQTRRVRFSLRTVLVLIGLVAVALAAFAQFSRSEMHFRERWAISTDDERQRDLARSRWLVSYLNNSVRVERVVKHFGVPNTVICWYEERPSAGISVDRFPQDREAFLKWFHTVQKRYVRVGTLWTQSDGSELGLEFREGYTKGKGTRDN